ETLYNLKNVDILITATGSSEYIIKSEHIKECLKLRKNDPIFLIDIAVPRDIDPKINDISGVYLYDIDDLKGVLNENMESRKESLVSAEEIVSYVHENFMNWMNSLKVFPTIVDLKSKFEKIKEQELIK
ncbi:MAG: glutamyl-tRNA reductase, partial [Candidatus Dadabacteria bacterium]|nr:glutamyl-tRNA reductase [Candidatus Dadabacteria bacterium]NIQ14946.1 glutamyl-tRNA reductase [Candidatus Dadabacteria bacterium]